VVQKRKKKAVYQLRTSFKKEKKCLPVLEKKKNCVVI